MPSAPLSDIVSFVRGRYDGPEVTIDGVAPLSEATATQLSFLSNPKYASQVFDSKAAAILVANDVANDHEAARLIRVENPYFAMASVVTRWFAERPKPVGFSPLAFIADTVTLGEGVSIGPFVSIGDRVVIGDNVTIYAHVTIEPDSVIGDGTTIYPNVSIYYASRIGKRCILHSGVVIGSDGYGFAQHEGRHHKIPQIGTVRIEDDVELGAGTTVDRGALGETVIGEGTKIDNLVQIGHNVKIGKHCLLVSQVGIAGSTELGDHVVVAGQSGFAGHLKIGARAQVAAKSAVLRDVPPDMKVMGNPAIAFGEFSRREVWLRRLPELARKLTQVERMLATRERR
jgi:UDP-3-O-[3-hydroxymyristoyl] glucosamine N-acyltransferase